MDPGQGLQGILLGIFFLSLLLLVERQEGMPRRPFTPVMKKRDRSYKIEVFGAEPKFIDLEDSVPPAEKEFARRNAFDYLAKRNANGPLEALRVNAIRTRWGLVEQIVESSPSAPSHK